MPLRILSASVLAPVTLAAVWAGSPWFAAFLAVVVLAAGAEWRTIAVVERPGLRMLLVAAPLFVLVAAEVAGPAAGLIVLVVGVVLAAGTFAAPGGERSWSVAALLHLGVAAIAIMYLRALPDAGRELVLALFVLVWLSDAGAYAFGHLIGGPKLAPRISPNKTWAGALGAFILTVLAAVVAADAFGLAGREIFIVAAVVSIAAQLGDLFESWVKRQFAVKDSGTLLPGHGGILDRIDGVLFAGPALALFVLLFGPGFLLWR